MDHRPSKAALSRARTSTAIPVATQDADHDDASFQKRRKSNFGGGVEQLSNEFQCTRERSSGSSFELNRKSRMLRSQHTVNNLISMQGPKDMASFKKDVDAVRGQIHHLNRRTLNPLSRAVRMWDMVIVCALLVTGLVSPFEVAFFTGDEALKPQTFNFCLNRLIDTVFVMDILVTFFMPYRMPAQKGGMMVYDNKRIVMHYIKGWFALDLLTVVPFDVIFALIVANFDWVIDPSAFRLLRLLRVLKLGRMLRASRIINRWRDHIAISFATFSLVFFLFLTCLLAHWLACLWGFMGVRSEEEWTGYAAGHLSWIQKARVPDSAGEWDLYIMCLYVALNAIFGGSCEIQSANYSEFGVQAVMLLIGSSVWAYVIGSACGIIATLDPARLAFRQTMDELNYFCTENMISTELAVRLRSYFRNTMHAIRASRYEDLLHKMSARLKGDAAYRMAEYRLRSVPFLVSNDLEPEFMCSIATRYRTSVYSRLERVPCTDLFVVERGIVAKRGALGLVGACFGKDVILSNDNLRDLGDAIALTFTQTISISQAHIFEFLPDFPKAFYIIRKAALKMALNRALVRAANIIKREAQAANGTAPKRSLIEIFDQAMRESEDAMLEEKRDQGQKSEVIPLSLKAVNVVEVKEGGGEKTSAALASLLGGTAPKRQLAGKGKWGTLGVKINAGEVPALVSAVATLADDGPRLEATTPAAKLASATQEVREQLKGIGERTAQTHEIEIEASEQFASRVSALEATMAAAMIEIKARIEAAPVRRRRLRLSPQQASPRTRSPQQPAGQPAAQRASPLLDAGPPGTATQLTG